MEKVVKTKPFIDKLIDHITEKKSHVVVGLDPVYENLPACLRFEKEGNINLRHIGDSIVEFNFKLIDAIYDLIPAVKPQIAFYEKYGIEGIKAFIKTISHAKKKGLIVIEDSKRNDIGSTAEAYSAGHIGRVKIGTKSKTIFDADAITVTPYLGSDGILPFIDDARKYQKGVFVLVKTSNPSSIEIQDIITIVGKKKIKLYEVVAELVDLWGRNITGSSGYSSLGAVVGATFPKEAKILRKLMPKACFLVPGYGFQGATASDVINCFNKDGYGAIISASRSINYAYKKDNRFAEKEFALAAREAVIKMNEEINNELKKVKLLKW